MSFNIGDQVVHIKSPGSLSGTVVSVWDASYGVGGPNSGGGVSPLLTPVVNTGVAYPEPYLVGNIIGVKWPSLSGVQLYPQEDLTAA